MGKISKKRTCSIILALLMCVSLAISSLPAAAASTVSEDIPDYDIWMADTLSAGYKTNSGERLDSLYSTFRKLSDPVYRQLGGYVLEDTGLLVLSETWSNMFNSDYRNQIKNQPKYVYELILMDYLKYDSDDGNAADLLDNNEMKFLTKLYSEVSDALDANKLGFVDESTSIEEITNVLNNIDTIKGLDEAISAIKDQADTAKALVEYTSEHLALQQAKKEKIYLLKEARDACSDQDFKDAANDLIKAIEGINLEFAIDKSSDYLWGKFCDKVWEKLGENSLLGVLELGAAGLDVLFNSSDLASNNLKLAYLYTVDNYMQIGMMNARSEFSNEETSESAIDFNSCFRSYIEFQRFGNDYAENWLDAIIEVDSTGIKSLFLKDEVETANDLKAKCETDNSCRKTLLENIDKYSSIYEKKYKKNIWGSRIANPVVEKDSSMTAGQKVTWACVWFGSYPQTEVVSEEDNAQIEALEKMNTYYETKYETVSADVFQKIESASYDSNGDAEIEGLGKYRRIKSDDATYVYTAKSTYEANYYYWLDDTSWHYFKYEPIKWRVLNVSNGEALLLADTALDDQEYNTEYKEITWGKSTIRSFLNNYGSSANTVGKDYLLKGFLNNAFNASEQNAIKTASFTNADNLTFGTEGGNGTNDEIFLLYESDIWATDSAYSYGFLKDDDTGDEARRCKTSTYAYAMGTYRGCSPNEGKNFIGAGNCVWWLRSPDLDYLNAPAVHYCGWSMKYGCSVSTGWGVRPALYLNLSYAGQYSYAGIVCSNGTVNEKGILSSLKKTTNKNSTTAANDGQTSPTKITVKSVKVSGISKKIAAGGKIKLTAKIAPSGASNKSLTWKSSNTKVATVSQSGVVKIKKGTGGKTVTITATAKDGSGKKASWKIKVAKGIVKKIKIRGAKSVKAGKSLKLKAKVTATKGANKKLRWTSSNKKYATVSQSGKVKTKKAGKGKKVKITAQATDGSGKKKTVTIKIK